VHCLHCSVDVIGTMGPAAGIQELLRGQWMQRDDIQQLLVIQLCSEMKSRPLAWLQGHHR
jgi:hypothetical protein